MVSGRYDVAGAGAVLPSGVPEDSWDFSLASQGGGMGVVIGGGGTRGGEAVAYEGIHLEAAEYHFGVYHNPPNLLTLHRGSQG